MTPSTNGYICDTNIWVKVVLGNVVDQFVYIFPNVHFADAVENEINKWTLNANKYKKIGTTFNDLKDTSLKVVYLEQLNSGHQILIKRQLTEYGFSELDNSRKTIKDLGEYLSLLYAYFLKIPFLQTEDVEFYGNININEQFKGIEIMTWNNIAEQLMPNHSERIKLNSFIELEQKNMSRKKEEFNSIENKYDLSN